MGTASSASPAMGAAWSSPEEREPLLPPAPPAGPPPFAQHGQSYRVAAAAAESRGRGTPPAGPLPRLAPVPGRVYGRRWLVLLLFSLLAFLQGLVWNTWGPIQNSARQAFGFSSLDIALLVFWGPIGFVPCFAFMWLMDKKGEEGEGRAREAVPGATVPRDGKGSFDESRPAQPGAFPMC